MHIRHDVFRRHPVQHAQGVEHIRRIAREAGDDATAREGLRPGSQRRIDEFPDEQRRRFVQVNRPGQVKDDGLMPFDVGADDARRFPRRCHRQARREGHQAGPGGEGIRIIVNFGYRQYFAVQQGH